MDVCGVHNWCVDLFRKQFKFSCSTWSNAFNVSIAFRCMNISKYRKVLKQPCSMTTNRACWGVKTLAGPWPGLALVSLIHIPVQLTFPSAHFFKHELTLFPAIISDYIRYKIWVANTYTFLNITGVTAEVWEWIHNFIPLFAGHVTHPCWDYVLMHFSKKGPIWVKVS